MKAVREMNQGELAAYIDSHLKANGVEVALSGGACVAVFSEYLYVSKDLDFVARFQIDHDKVEYLMGKLGFSRKGRYFAHPESEYFVEFISGPLTVGEELIEDIHEMEFSTGMLRIISPTDSVKDRLAAFFHWGDRQALAQAALVAARQAVDIEKIRAWSVREGKGREFEEFLGEISG